LFKEEEKMLPTDKTDKFVAFQEEMLHRAIKGAQIIMIMDEELL
jgi:hypothetical protein